MTIHYYEQNIIPEKDTIFVFGSNPKGIHGAGSARVALLYFNAKYGVGEGPQGDAYALPTKDLDKACELKQYCPSKGDDLYDALMDFYSTHPYSDVLQCPVERSISPNKIMKSIQKLYQYANEHPSKKFKIAYRNQKDEFTLNGYFGGEMIELFKQAGPIPNNMYFSKEWIDSGLFSNFQITQD